MASNEVGMVSKIQRLTALFYFFFIFSLPLS